MFVFIDILRAAAFLAVLVFHFAAERGMRGAPIDYSMTYGQFSVPAVAVALFFILSGFGLMLGAKKKERFSVKEFYSRRFLRIMIPYYLVSAVYLIFLFIRAGGYPFDHSVPAWRMVFLIPGMSSYLSYHGFPCIDMGIGEWFLGALVLMYLVFPLLKICLDRWNHVFFISFAVLYLVWVFVYPFHMPEYTGFSVKLFVFLFGMWAAKNFSTMKPWAAFPAAAVLVLSFLPLDLPVKIEYWITADAICIFSILFVAEPALSKMPQRIRRFLRHFGNLEYALFLVHHIVINEMGAMLFFSADPSSKKRMLLLAFLVVLIMTGAAFLVNAVSDRLIGLIRRKRKAEPCP